MSRILLSILALFLAFSGTTQAQLLGPGSSSPLPNPLSNPGMDPGKTFLFELEAKFARATAQGGGKAFATFFAEDGVTLSNKQAPVVGRAAIAAKATWSPAEYQLLWTPEGGQMGPSGDAGFTWGHYEGRSIDRNGNGISITGRYITFWKRQSNGEWKVALDASNDEPPAAGDCCKLP